jgi:hypothetical protein
MEISNLSKIKIVLFYFALTVFIVKLYSFGYNYTNSKFQNSKDLNLTKKIRKLS